MIVTSHYCKLVVLNVLLSQMLVCGRSAWWSESEMWQKLMHMTWWLTNGRWNLIVVLYFFCWSGPDVKITAIAGVDVVGRVECWKITIVFFVLRVESSGTNDGNIWRLCSGRVECQKIAVGLLFWRLGLAVQTTAISGIYVTVGLSLERITSDIVLVY